MAARFVCPVCWHVVDGLGEEWLGQRMKCPECHARGPVEVAVDPETNRPRTPKAASSRRRKRTRRTGTKAPPAARFVCPACWHVIDNLPPHQIGQRLRCPECHALGQVEPAPEEEAPPAPPTRSRRRSGVKAAPPPLPPPPPPVQVVPAQQAMILFPCPACGQLLQVPLSAAGTLVLCPMCREPTRAPALPAPRR